MQHLRHSLTTASLGGPIIVDSVRLVGAYPDTTIEVRYRFRDGQRQLTRTFGRLWDEGLHPLGVGLDDIEPATAIASMLDANFFESL